MKKKRVRKCIEAPSVHSIVNSFVGNLYFTKTNLRSNEGNLDQISRNKTDKVSGNIILEKKFIISFSIS